MNRSPHASNSTEAKIQNAIYFLECRNALVQFSQQLKCVDQERVVTLSWQSEHLKKQLLI